MYFPETGKSIEMYRLKQAPVLGKLILIIPKVIAKCRLDSILCVLIIKREKNVIDKYKNIWQFSLV